MTYRTIHQITDKPTLAKAFAEFTRNPLTESTKEPVTEVADDVAGLFKMMFDSNGPFYTAKKLGVLVNNSGEELALEFMSWWNHNFYTAY